MAKSKLAKYRRRRKANPETKAIVDLATNIGAGFAGYTATRFVSRVAYSQAVKRWPNASKHVYAAASALSAAGVFAGTRYWKRAGDYHEPAVIGAGIALIQTLIQTYLPKFGWIVADVNAEQYGATKKRAPALPAADLSTLFDESEPMPELAPAPQSSFDLEALLAQEPDLEAVPIGQASPIVPETPTNTGADDADFFEAFGNADGIGGSDDLENFNGMLN